MQPPEQIRCFIAIELTSSAKDSLEDVILALTKSLRTGFRWTPVRNIHLTLKFLGNTPKQAVPKIIEILHAITNGIEGFSITIQQLGAFPNLRQPRILWAGINAPPQLFNLQKLVDVQTIPLGFPGETRRFSPHLTLARSMDTISPKDIQLLTEVLESSAPAFSIPVNVQHITLFESQLQPRGPTYLPLGHVQLKPGAEYLC